MKRKTELLFVLLAALMLCTATEVMAQTFPPESCMAGPYTVSTNTDNFPLAMPIYSQTDPNFALYPCYKPCPTSPCPPCDFPYYVYAYGISPMSNISRIVELIPVCEYPINILAIMPATGQVNPPGVTDNSAKWPSAGIYDNFSVGWPSNPQAGKFWIATNTSGIDVNALTIRSGNTLNYCLDGIAGPGCGILPSYAPTNTGGSMQLSTYSVCYSTNPKGCITRLWNCDNPSEVYTLEKASKLYECTGPFGDTLCRQCIQYSEESPGCYEYTSPDGYTRIPTGCCSTNLPCRGATKKYCCSGYCRITPCP